jgi:hypothetical protein
MTQTPLKTGTTLPPPPPIKPASPLMGTTEETYTGSNSFYYAFGGEPKPDWSGIKDLSSRLLSDLCFRSLDPVSGQKSTHYRTKGLAKLYERGQKLSEFQKHIWEHLTKYGLDTVAYLPDPKNPLKVQSVITHHARFTGDLNKALQSSKILQTKFDTWDKKHDYEARQFLLNSISETVKEGFETFHEIEDTFSATWLKLVHYLVTTTSKTYDEMKEAIRKKRPQQYPGQDIEKMASDYIQLAKEIDNAGYYTHSLTLNMVDGFLCSSQDAKGTFHHALNNLREKVSAKEQETVFMSSEDQTRKFAQAKLSYKDVCLHSVKIYNELKHNNMWEPSKLPKDRQAPMVNLTKAQILNLIESVHKPGRQSSKPKGACFNCGDPNHQVKDCPKPKPSPEDAKAKRHATMPKWKLTAPAQGEPKVKTVNGKTFKWCAKCGNWTTTHDTSTHTGKTKPSNVQGKKTSFKAESNLAAWEPSAWIVETDCSDSSSTITMPMILQYCYITLTFAYFVLNPTWTTVETFISFITTGIELIKQSYYDHFDYILATSAPALWFALGFMTCHLASRTAPPFNPVIDLSLTPRHLRRQRHKKQGSKLKSAKDFKLHRSYPLRLRNDNQFNPHSVAPTVKARRQLDFSQTCANDPNHHHNFDPSYCCRHQPNSKHHAKKCKRGATSAYARSISHPNDFPSKHIKPKTNVYTPKGVPNHRDFPNLNYTSKQYKCMKHNAHSILVADTVTDKETKSMAEKIACLAPSGFHTAMQSTGKHRSFPIIWDSGASICITPDKSDFISYKRNPDINEVKGLGGKKSSVAGQGEVLWSIHDTNGTLRHLKLEAYHIPHSKSRLISTNALLKKYKGEYLTINSSTLQLSGIKGDNKRSPVIAFNNPMTHLPTTTAYRYNETDTPSEVLCQNISTVNAHNTNLSEAQKELLRWHQRLGHLAFKKIQHLMRTGVLSHTEGTRKLHTASSKLIHPPKCAACLFGKQTIRSAPGTTTRVIRDRAGILRAGNLLPGAEVSVDHFISSVKGRLFSGYDKGSDDNRHVGGCIFIDHASSYIHVEFQSSLSTHETLRAKLAFEQQCRDVGVVVQKYMSDNGTAFTSQDFTDHLTYFQQVSKFAGVGAHHHNAQAERAIRTIMSISRTMMIHAGIHWPDMAKPTLWPMAVSHACYLYNHVPNPSTGLSPSDIFTKSRWPHKRFHDMHVWGCPIYVLDKSLQDGKKIPRWRPRSNRSVYMGVSQSHASSVPLALNVSTGSITPQFHIVFDDWFATVSSSSNELPDFGTDEWNKMFGDSIYQYVLDDDNADEPDSDLPETMTHAQQSDIISQRQQDMIPSTPLPVPPPAETPLTTGHISKRGGSTETSTSNINTDMPSVVPQISAEVAPNSTPIDPTPTSDSNPERKQEPTAIKQPVTRSKSSLNSPRRSSRRVPNPVKRLTYTHDKSSFTGKDYKASLAVPSTFDPIPDSMVLLVSAGKKEHPDIFSYEEAMNGEHRLEWIEAAKKEIESLEKFGCWKEIPTSKATTKVLPGTWVFRVKRAPDGSFKKFKARYCIRGDLQEGDFETYAPVVSFSSVRLFLAWSIMLGWHTCTIDFSNAFIQADLKEPTFIHLPRGFQSNSSTSTCLQLKKSIYGLSVAPRLWFQHLLKALTSEGLVQSKYDPCLLYRNNLIVICYVDDLGLQVPKKEIADQLIDSLKKKGFELTREGSFTEYLGIQYDHLDDGGISMTQTGLIQKLLEATGMQECNSNRTPTTREALGSDPDGEPMQDTWNYRSVVGMLLYLSTNTRPDIAFAVSQVARFSHNPKSSHASAVKTILRYLSGSKNKGVVYKRPKLLTLDCYVDADFAGLYGREPPEDPMSVKSRTGYIISVGGCFLLCKSQLQSTIALSTSESEYGALSQAMRTLLPIRETIVEIINNVDMVDSVGKAPFGPRNELLKFKTYVHEDNTTALSLANNQKVTSRTKHWCVKFHFFWSHINNKDNNIACVKVDTKEQRADYLTKGLTRELFEHCRDLNQGW